MCISCCATPCPLLHICILGWRWGRYRFYFLGSMPFFVIIQCGFDKKWKHVIEACHWTEWNLRLSREIRRNETHGNTNRAKPFQGVTEVTSGGVRKFGADAAKNGISRRLWRWCGRQERRIWEFPSAGSSAPGTQQGAYVQPSRGDTHCKPYESTPQPSPIEINMDIESKKAIQTSSTSNQVDARKPR